MAEIGDDEGILGNDFAMAHELTVRPCEGAVYLPDLAGTGKGHMGERLPCTIRSVTEVRAVTEETLVVRAVGSATLAPHTVTEPIQIDKDEVVAMAECVLAEPGASAGNDRDDGDEVNWLVERASPHLTSEECRQLQAAMAARKHLFAKGKGDLGRTDIVQHQIHMGDQPRH